MIYPEFKKEKVNFVVNQGGLGDCIARMPALKYIAQRHPHVEPQIWVADYFYPLAKNMLPNLYVNKFSNREEFNEKYPGRQAEHGPFNNLKTHMTVHAFCMLANEIPSIEYMNYIKLNLEDVKIEKFKLPKKYVCMTVAHTAPIREFIPEYVNEVVDYIKSKGYEIVFLGAERSDAGLPGRDIIGNVKKEIDFSKGKNLINCTTLLECAKIMSESELVIGVDNGLLNLAACTDVKILGGYTSVNPIHRLPVRENKMGHNFWTVVPPDSEPEKFCQSIWDLTFKHDFKFSYYEDESLIRSLKPDLWIEQLEKIMSIDNEETNKLEGIDEYEIDAWIDRLGSMPIETVAHSNKSEAYEMNRAHVLKLADNRYALVTESGCSCYSSSDACVDLFPDKESAMIQFRKWQKENK